MNRRLIRTTLAVRLGIAGPARRASRRRLTPLTRRIRVMVVAMGEPVVAALAVVVMVAAMAVRVAAV
ncbi:TPA: hypothetical protein ACRN1S_006742, partial [Pseudomonas aeruginosa]